MKIMHDGPNVQQIKKVHILKDDSSVVHSGAEETRPNQRFSVAFPLIGRFFEESVLQGNESGCLSCLRT